MQQPCMLLLLALATALWSASFVCASITDPTLVTQLSSHVTHLFTGFNIPACVAPLTQVSYTVRMLQYFTSSNHYKNVQHYNVLCILRSIRIVVVCYSNGSNWTCKKCNLVIRSDLGKREYLWRRGDPGVPEQHRAEQLQATSARRASIHYVVHALNFCKSDGDPSPMGKRGTSAMMLRILMNAEPDQPGAKELGLLFAKESDEVLMLSNQRTKAVHREYLAADL